MENYREDLVGPRSEDHKNNTLAEEVSANGEPLWMAFINDPEALSLSKDDVQDAKNALAEMKTQQPEIIKMCAHKSIEECKDIVRSLHSGEMAA
jgi:predicted aconitase